MSYNFLLYKFVIYVKKKWPPGGLQYLNVYSIPLSISKVYPVHKLF